jgi:hypothetical protein
MRIQVRLLPLGLLLLNAIGTGHSTMVVEQKEVSVTRALAGHIEVLGN